MLSAMINSVNRNKSIEPAADSSSVTLSVIGDVVFGGPFAADPLGLTEQVSPEVLALLRADICLANLECVLADEPPGPIDRGVDFAMLAPVRSVEALRRLGVTVVTLANNHTMDYGAAGLDSTLKALEAAGMSHFGAGRNIEEASRLLVLERQGLKIGLIGFGSNRATRTRPGSVPLDGTLSRHLVRTARKQCDFVIVYFHGGIEATHYPKKVQMAACHQLVECGADLVLGTHPHTIQGMEVYHGVHIFYSVGDFIAPMHLPDARQVWQRQTALAKTGYDFDVAVIERALALQVTLRRGRTPDVRPVPIRVGDDGLPQALAESEQKEAETFFANLCEAFGRPDDPVWRRRDEIERATNRLGLQGISLGFVLRNLYRIRPRHVIEFFKLLLSR
jgi:hypothetical protein